MTTASHDAKEHVLFDYASKHTQHFRLTIKITFRVPAYFRQKKKISRLRQTFDYGNSTKNVEQYCSVRMVRQRLCRTTVRNELATPSINSPRVGPEIQTDRAVEATRAWSSCGSKLAACHRTAVAELSKSTRQKDSHSCHTSFSIAIKRFLSFLEVTSSNVLRACSSCSPDLCKTQAPLTAQPCELISLWFPKTFHGVVVAFWHQA
jgi:hypothetical protein